VCYVGVQTLDPSWEGAILRGWGKGRPIVKHRDTAAVICAKTAEPIDLPFGLWTLVTPCSLLSQLSSGFFFSLFGVVPSAPTTVEFTTTVLTRGDGRIFIY